MRAHPVSLKAALAAALATAALGPSAAAQTAGAERPIEAINDQLQWGDVFSSMSVVSRNSTSSGSASASAASVANSALADSVSGVAMTSQQMSGARTQAEAELEADDACCQAVTAATAQNNALELRSSRGPVTLNAAQGSGAGETGATTRTNIGETQSLTTAATAAANNLAVSARHSVMDLEVDQEAQGPVTALNDTDACCSGTTMAASSAGANSFASSSYSGRIEADVSQTSSGPSVSAATDLYQYTGYDASASAAAAGNSAAISNQYDTVEAKAWQGNGSAVQSEARLTLGSWEGSAVASASGVGNAIIAGNVGADLTTDTEQVNMGEVRAYAGFEGGANATSNGAAGANATAIGNAYTGSVCSACGEARLVSTLRQSNEARINSTGSLNASGAIAASGSASAIGNSATFYSATTTD